MEFNGPIPLLGYNYHFFDDGKMSPSRHYIATVVDIIPFDKIGTIQYEDLLGPERREKYLAELKKGECEEGPSLLEVWEDEVHHCDWIYTKETDFIIKCSIPEYDENPIYFARTIDKGNGNGWFSMDTVDGWQSGQLDVDCSLFDGAYRGDDHFHKYWVEHRIINYDDIEKIYKISPETIENLIKLLETPNKEEQ